MERNDDFYSELMGSDQAATESSEDQKPKDDFWAGFEAAKKAEAEAAARHAAEEERKAAEKRAAEEAAAKKAEAEVARMAALEAARKAAEEAKLLAERAAKEAEAARKAEEETKKRIAEEAAKKAAEEEARKAAEEAAKKAAEEEEAKKAAEEAAKKAAEEEEAKKAAEEAAKKAEEEAKKAAEEAKKAKKSGKKKPEKKPDKKSDSKPDKKSEKKDTSSVEESEKKENSNAVNIKAVVAVAIICAVVVVLSYVGTYILFKGGSVASMSGEKQKENVENEITSALQAADVGFDFSISNGKLSIASENSYVIFFRDGYSLYKMTGNYSRSGLSNKEKIAAAASSKTSVENAELICDCLTSYYLNMKDIDNQTVTLNVKLTDEDGKEFVVDKTVSVNVVSTSAPAGASDSEAGGETAE